VQVSSSSSLRFARSLTQTAETAEAVCFIRRSDLPDLVSQKEAAEMVLVRCELPMQTRLTCK
jgi:hypothetical protein